tara:strand:+ start:5264 stop:5794 length:531 start_codon:yes stop_codon:yes gene_type:complete
MSKKEDKKREEMKKMFDEMKKDLPEGISEEDFMQNIVEKLGDHMNINTDYDMNDEEKRFDDAFQMFEHLSKFMTTLINTAMYHYTDRNNDWSKKIHPEQVLHTILNAVLVQIFIRSPDDETAKEIITDLTNQLDTASKLAKALREDGLIESLDSSEYREKMDGYVSEELTEGETIH